MNIKNYRGLSLLCCLVALNILISHSAAWGGCTAQERIELGKQGYDKDKVESICADNGEDFWEALSKSVITNLANGATDSLTKSLNKALVGREKETSAVAPTPKNARVCVTEAGTCSLSGVPSGAPCYCQAWNGATFTGFSR